MINFKFDNDKFDIFMTCCLNFLRFFLNERSAHSSSKRNIKPSKQKDVRINCRKKEIATFSERKICTLVMQRK